MAQETAEEVLALSADLKVHVEEAMNEEFKDDFEEWRRMCNEMEVINAAKKNSGRHDEKDPPNRRKVHGRNRKKNIESLHGQPRRPFFRHKNMRFCQICGCVESGSS